MYIGLIQTETETLRTLGSYTSHQDALEAARAVEHGRAGKVAYCAIREDVHPPSPTERIDLLARLQAPDERRRELMRRMLRIGGMS